MEKITPNHFQINITPEGEHKWVVRYIPNIHGLFNLYVKVHREDIARSPFRIDIHPPGQERRGSHNIDPDRLHSSEHHESDRRDSKPQSELRRSHFAPIQTPQFAPSPQRNSTHRDRDSSHRDSSRDSSRRDSPHQNPSRQDSSGQTPQFGHPDRYGSKYVSVLPTTVLPPKSKDSPQHTTHSPNSYHDQQKTHHPKSFQDSHKKPHQDSPQHNTRQESPHHNSHNNSSHQSDPEVVPQHCKATGPGLSNLTASTTGKFAVSLVDTNGDLCSAEYGKLDIKITNESGKSCLDDFTLVKNIIKGFHIVQITASQGGKFSMRLLINDQDIMGSPFSLNVSFPPIDPDMCTVKGPGIVTAVQHSWTKFAVLLSDSIGNDLPPESGHVTITWQDDTQHNANSFFESKIDQSHGITMVNYLCRKPGTYSLNVNVNSEPVANSPFRVVVQQEIDETDDEDWRLSYSTIPPIQNDGSRRRSGRNSSSSNS
jgi:hypothetical protein